MLYKIVWQPTLVGKTRYFPRDAIHLNGEAVRFFDNYQSVRRCLSHTYYGKDPVVYVIDENNIPWEDLDSVFNPTIHI